MGAVTSILKIIFILVVGQLLGAILGGLAQSMGLISFGPADPRTVVFSLFGIVIVAWLVAR